MEIKALRAGVDRSEFEVAILLPFLKAKPKPSTDQNERIYAIGDVHGRFDLLCELIQRIVVHNAERSKDARVRLILLGDLIDRGPQSAQVLRLAHIEHQRSGQLTVIAGNHEDIMIKALDGDIRAARFWLHLGGVSTMRSFSVDVDEEADDEALAEYLLAFRRVLGEQIVDWLRQLPLTMRSGDYFFCHAGVRPRQALEDQTREDLLWIRKPFLGYRKSYGAVVVHGHSISKSVDIKHNRISVDTGAYRTDILSAICLENRSIEIIST